MLAWLGLALVVGLGAAALANLVRVRVWQALGLALLTSAPVLWLLLSYVVIRGITGLALVQLSIVLGISFAIAGVVIWSPLEFARPADPRFMRVLALWSGLAWAGILYLFVVGTVTDIGPCLPPADAYVAIGKFGDAEAQCELGKRGALLALVMIVLSYALAAIVRVLSRAGHSREPGGLSPSHR